MHPPGGMIFDKHDKSRCYLTSMTVYMVYSQYFKKVLYSIGSIRYIIYDIIWAE